MKLDDFSEVDLLALLIAGESDGESLAGQVAVACVPVERLRRGRWGATLQEVMLQPYQFSTFNGEHWLRFVPRIEVHRTVAKLAIRNLLNSHFPGATHYHVASGLWPEWSRSYRMLRTGQQLGAHVFYMET